MMVLDNADSTVLEFNEWLVACDEAVAAGVAPSFPPVPEPLRPKLQAALACLELLDRDRRRASPALSLADQPLAPVPAPAAEQLRLGRFLIRRELGRGAYGVVYLAHDPLLLRDVALKVPRLGAALSPGLRQRFLREARVGALLSHPNLVKVHEAGEVGALCYIASDYCPGGTLAAWLRRQESPVPFREAAALVAALADGVAVIHGAGIRHRDLKPSNVLLAGEKPESVMNGVPGGPASPCPRPMIADFGLAKFLDDEDGDATRTGIMIGTPQYMAPEQAEGRPADVDAPADIYALGIILFEVLTGHAPFWAHAGSELTRHISKTEPIAPHLLRSDVPRDLETVCLKCLEKDPKRRYGSAKDLAEDLRRFLVGEPVKARPVGHFERAARWVRRHRRLSAGLAAACLALGTIGTLAAAVIQQQGQRLHDTQVANAHLALDKGIDLCQRGEVAHGLLWLQHGLEQTPVAEAELRREFRDQAAAWLADSPELVAMFPAAGCKGVTVRADGSLLCFVGTGDILHIGDIPTSRFTHTLKEQGELRLAEFDPTGRTLIAYGAGRTAMLDAATGAERYCHKRLPAPGRVAFHPDGRSVCRIERDGTLAWWDVATGACRQRFVGDGSTCRQLRFTPDGTLLFALDGSRTWRVWETATGREVEPLGTGKPMEEIVFHPDGSIAATLGSEMRLWDVASREPLAPALPLPDSARALAAVLGPGRGEVRLFLNSGKVQDWVVLEELWYEVGALVLAPRHFQQGAFSNRGQRLAALTAGDEMIRVWDLPAPRSRPLTAQAAFSTRFVAWGPELRRAALVSLVREVQPWDLAAGSRVRGTLPHPSALLTAAYSPDGRLLVTGGNHPTAVLWDAATGRQRHALDGHRSDVCAAAFTPDGNVLYTASSTGEIRGWDPATGEVRLAPPAQPGGIYALAVCPSGNTLAVAGCDGVVSFWERCSGQSHGAPLPHGGPVRWVTYRPDGGALLTASYVEHTARLWDTNTGALLGPPIRHGDRIEGIGFSREGGAFFTLSQDRTVRVWDAKTAAPLGPSLYHESAPTAAAFTPDGARLVCAVEGGQVIVWDFRSGRRVGSSIRHAGKAVGVAFAPDGSLWSVSGEGRFVVTRLPPRVEGNDLSTKAITARTGALLRRDGMFELLRPAEWRSARMGLTAAPPDMP